MKNRDMGVVRVKMKINWSFCRLGKREVCTPLIRFTLQEIGLFIKRVPYTLYISMFYISIHSHYSLHLDSEDVLRSIRSGVLHIPRFVLLQGAEVFVKR